MISFKLSSCDFLSYYLSILNLLLVIVIIVILNEIIMFYHLTTKDFHFRNLMFLVIQIIMNFSVLTLLSSLMVLV